MKVVLFILTLFLSAEFCSGQTNLRATCTDSTLLNIQETIAFYKGRLSVDSFDQVSYYKLGISYYKLKEYKLAIEFYDKLITLNINYPQALSNRGICKLLSNQTKGACDDFNLSIKLGQDPPAIDGQKLSKWVMENGCK